MTTKFNIKSNVSEVPKVTKNGGGTKYGVVFEAATASETGIITVGFDGNVDVAQARANYMRRVAPDGFTAAHRDGTVFVTDEAKAAAYVKAQAKAAKAA